jgi:uncharacterized protein (TIGR01244 family)
MPTRPLPMVPLALVALTLAGCASTPARDPIPPAPRYATPVSQAPVEAGAELEAAPKFYKAGRLYVGGQPDADALDAMARDGVTMVINLRSEREMADPAFAGWGETVESMGVEYVHIPLGGSDGYEPEDVEAFNRALARCDGAALVHCASGGRARVMWTAHLIDARGYDPNAANEVVLTMGGQRSALEKLLGREMDARLGAPLPPPEDEKSPE